MRLTSNIAASFLKLVSGKGREVHWMMYLVSVAFVFYFLLGLFRSGFGI